MSRLRSPIALLAIALFAKTLAGHFAAVWYGYDYWVLPVVMAAASLLLTIILFAGDSCFEPVLQSQPIPNDGRIDLWRKRLEGAPQAEMAYTPEWVHYLTLTCIGIGALSLLSLITIPVFRLALNCLPVGMQVAFR
jgi:hypothetical protein